MRKKALLVGALSPFTGPWVFIEEGEWVVESPSLGGEFQLEIEDIGLFSLGIGDLIVKGPTRIRAIVIEGEAHINAKQLQRAG